MCISLLKVFLTEGIRCSSQPMKTVIYINANYIFKRCKIQMYINVTLRNKMHICQWRASYFHAIVDSWPNRLFLQNYSWKSPSSTKLCDYWKVIFFFEGLRQLPEITTTVIYSLWIVVAMGIQMLFLHSTALKATSWVGIWLSPSTMLLGAQKHTHTHLNNV